MFINASIRILRRKKFQKFSRKIFLLPFGWAASAPTPEAWNDMFKGPGESLLAWLNEILTSQEMLELGEIHRWCRLFHRCSPQTLCWVLFLKSVLHLPTLRDLPANYRCRQKLIRLYIMFSLIFYFIQTVIFYQKLILHVKHFCKCKARHL